MKIRCMMKSPDCIVVGGGAAGMMGAITAARLGKHVVIVEKNSVLGRKLLITGKGRCNVTNACDSDTFFQNVVSNSLFLRSAYSNFSAFDVISFFENVGEALKTERGNRVFPVSDSAKSIVNAFIQELKKLKIEVVTGCVEKILTQDGQVVGLCLADGQIMESRNILIATGGMSYPKTGSTGDGYMLAEQCGHTIIPLRPGLVPIQIEQSFICSELQGLSLKNVTLTVKRDHVVVYQDFGEMLFTHYGVSGPIILSASSFVKKGDQLILDLKPALDENVLDKRICRDFEKNGNKDFCNAMGQLLPSKLIPVVVRLSDINPHKKANSITKIERAKIVRILKEFTLKIAGLRPIEEAVITVGGVNVKEVDPKTMQSKLMRGLYFAGEVLDVDAYTGGFNLQIAFCTGHRAGESLK